MGSQTSTASLREPPARPFLKWAGGKGQLLGRFERLYPRRVDRYIEPFVGSAAVFFGLRRMFPRLRAFLSDNNDELINCFEVVRDDVEGLIRSLRRHRSLHGKEHYYRVRGRSPSALSAVQRASRLIYLNKTCFNGLYRVNAKGEFNVPLGSYDNPAILKADALRAASAALQGVRLSAGDFGMCLGDARPGTFVYIDPPYHPVSRTANFTAYTEGGFGIEEQERLAGLYRDLDAIGCLVMLSNSYTAPIRRLYRGFHLIRVRARRAINSDGSRRGTISELVVVNYDTGGDASGGDAERG